MVLFLKIVYRLPQDETIKIEQENISSIKEKEDFEDAIKYINKYKKSYTKYCQKHNSTNPIDFVQKEKQQLVKRMVKTLNKRIEDIK